MNKNIEECKALLRGLGKSQEAIDHWDNHLKHATREQLIQGLWFYAAMTKGEF